MKIRTTILLCLLNILFSRVVLAAQPSACFYFDQQQDVVHFKVRANQLNKTTTFSITELWKYDSNKKQWVFKSNFTFINKTIEPNKISEPNKSTIDMNLVIQSFKNLTGLYWVKWTENEANYQSFIHAGMKCQDVMIGPSEKGDQVAECVPAKNSARAEYVPKPNKYCIRKMSNRDSPY